MSDTTTPHERELISRAVARLRASLLGLALGLTAATGLASLTAWLVLLGGDEVGPHLGLLSNFFPGYSVSWAGVAVGFAYAFAAGFAGGFTVAQIYNRLVDSSSRRRSRKA